MILRSREALARIGYDLDVRRPVGEFSVAEQQAVELAKALRKRARLILLDEPTSTLPQPDVKRLFEVLRKLADDGVSLLYISHRMEELYALCDHVTVLRDGRNAADFAIADSRPADVVSAMVGKSLKGSLSEAAISGERSPRLGSGRTDRVLLSAKGLSEEGKVENVDIHVYEREVLGDCGAGRQRTVGIGRSSRRRPDADRWNDRLSKESRCASSRRATRSGSAWDFCRRTARRKASCRTCRSRGTSRSRACRCSRSSRC